MSSSPASNLRDLMSKVDRSEDLEALLENVLQNKDALTALSGELGVEESAEGAEDKGSE